MRGSMLMSLLVAAPCWLASAAGAAAAADPGRGENMIVVKGQLIDADSTAWSVTTLDTDQIRRDAPTDFDDLLRLVPGMTVRDLGLGGVANSIVIRGFGGGGHGGDLGAVLDGIPLNEAMSHADGYVDLNIIVPLEVDTMTVFRGPVSALYGNYNRGGLIKIVTRKGGDYLNADASLADHATADVQMAAGRSGRRAQLNLAGQLYLTDGYRPHSDLARQTLAMRGAFDASDTVNVALSGRYHHADANSASYLTQDQFENDPYGIDPNVQGDGARKTFRSLRTDVNIALSPTTSLVTFGYLTRQDFTRWFTRPVSASEWRQREESYDRRIFGAGTSLNGLITPGWSAGPIAYVVGLEHFRESTDFLFFDGLNSRHRTAPPLDDRRTRLNSLSGFVEVQAPVHRLFDLSLGLRADRFTGGCKPLGPETGSDPCGALRKTARLSPKIGLRSQLTDWLQIRGNWAEGFALPNNFVKYSVGGQVLDPNVFRQTEIGLHLTPVDGLKVDLAAFRLLSTAEVRAVAPGLYENFGKTSRKGMEASAEWQLSPRLWLRSVYSYTRTRVRQNGDPALVGKEVAGVPRHAANVEASWSPVEDWTLSADWRYVGSYQINATNTARARRYDTLGLSLAYEATAPFPYRAYVRIDNLADTRYATSVSVIGGLTVLAPGSPRTARAGIQITL